MLEEFDYEVCHRPGRQVKHVDALSRYPIMMISSHDITQKIKEAQNKDEFISQLKSAIKIKHLLEDELSEQFINKRETLRNEAKENILRLQDENKKQYNKHRKPPLITTNQVTQLRYSVHSSELD
ncbi:hypothetical protein TNCV_3987001 [Trichonephila clavipes]|nr:hypothetical protein TNCV_3987001 [Trichonephila clavipes]